MTLGLCSRFVCEWLVSESVILSHIFISIIHNANNNALPFLFDSFYHISIT